MTKWTFLRRRKRVGEISLFILLFILFAIFPYLPLAPIGDRLSAEPVVLFVGDTLQVYGQSVINGIRRAIPAIHSSDLRVAIVNVPEPRLDLLFLSPAVANIDDREQRTLLIQAIAAHNVVGIISANTSVTAKTTLAVAERFKVPVLLTVATNDALIGSRSTLVGRLVPRDNLQSEAIRTWVDSVAKSQPGSIVVLYDPSRYGFDLVDHLRATVSGVTLIPLPLGTTTETMGLINYARQLKVTAWVVLAYQAQAIDVVIKARAMGVHDPILLSDGAYGNWLLRTDSLTFISFPASEVPQTTDPLRGYAVFGHDALVLFSEGVEVASKQHQSRRELVEAMFSEGTTDTGGNLLHRYAFNNVGEDTTGHFVVTVGQSLFSRSPSRAIQ